MSAPNDPNAPPSEFALSPSPAGPPAKPPAPRTAEAAAKGVKVVARAGRDGPERERARRARRSRTRRAASARSSDVSWAANRPGRNWPSSSGSATPWACATTTRCGWCCWRCNTSGGNSSTPSRASGGQFEHSIDRRLAETRQATDALIESAKTRFLEQFPAALKQAARRVSIRALGFNGPVVLSGPVAGVALALAGLGVVGAGWLAYELGERVGLRAGNAGGAGRGRARAETARVAGQGAVTQMAGRGTASDWLQS